MAAISKEFKQHLNSLSIPQLHRVKGTFKANNNQKMVDYINNMLIEYKQDNIKHGLTVLD